MINPNWTNNISQEDWLNPVVLARYDKVVHIAQDIIDYRWTVRQAARNYCVGKSTVSRWIERYLKYLDSDLYREVKNELNFHKRYTRSWRYVV